VVLYGLSMLARYHPVAWVEALDLDSSPAAALLGHALDVALDLLPELVLGTLMGRPGKRRFDASAQPAGEATQ